MTTDADFPYSDHGLVIRALNGFCWHVEKILTRYGHGLKPILEDFLTKARELRKMVPRGGLIPTWAAAYPIFYPFAGVDMMTPNVLFPNATEIIMTSNLPLGDFTCFQRLREFRNTNPGYHIYPCHEQWTATVLNFFGIWSKVGHSSLGAAGNSLAHALAKDKSVQSTGILPILVFTTYLLMSDEQAAKGDDNTHVIAKFVADASVSEAQDSDMISWGDAKYSRPIDDFSQASVLHPDGGVIDVISLSYRNCTSKLTYVWHANPVREPTTWLHGGSGFETFKLTQEAQNQAKAADPYAGTSSHWLVAALQRISNVAGLKDEPRVTLIKEAALPEDAQPFADDEVARYVMDTSVATFHDSTGLQPSAYNQTSAPRNAWVVRSTAANPQFSTATPITAWKAMCPK